MGHARFGFDNTQAPYYSPVLQPATPNSYQKPTVGPCVFQLSPRALKLGQGLAQGENYAPKGYVALPWPKNLQISKRSHAKTATSWELALKQGS